MNIDEICDHLLRTWGQKTPTDFLHEAEREATSIVYESLRSPGGPRLALIVCVADIDQITRLEGVFELTGSDPPTATPSQSSNPVYRSETSQAWKKTRLLCGVGGLQI